MIHFPISGVETSWWLPVVVAFGVAAFSSTGGVSGAFLLMPFQVTVLGFAGPGASATNLLYNILATPSGVYRFYRERRIAWPLTWTLILATLPASLLGALIRVFYLPDAKTFKVFAGLVLLLIGGRLAASLLPRKGEAKKAAAPGGFAIASLEFGPRRIGYEFDGAAYRLATWKLAGPAFLLGIVAGAYGIGGGALMAPILVAVYRLPVHSIAGATLLSTFASSLVGVIFYTAASVCLDRPALAIAPDWQLGALFGVGGAAGVYTGAWLQRFMPALAIKLILAAITLFIAGKYLLPSFA